MTDIASATPNAILPATPIWGLPNFTIGSASCRHDFFAGDHSSAVDAALNAQRLLWSAAANFETAEFQLYGALAHAAACEAASGDERRQHFEALVAHHKQIEVWAEHNPVTFENRAAIVGAEIARIEGRVLDAQDLYEKAVRSAHTNGFVHNEAIANERAGVLLRGARLREDCDDLPAGCPPLLPPLGSGWKGSTTRAALSADQSREVDLRMRQRRYRHPSSTSTSRP